MQTVRALQVAAVCCRSLHDSTAPPCILSSQTSLQQSVTLLSCLSLSSKSDSRTGGSRPASSSRGGIAGGRNNKLSAVSRFYFRNLKQSCLKFLNYRDCSCSLLSAGRNKALHIVSRFVQSLLRQVGSGQQGRTGE